jgi:peptidyl-prolyl cis-trans isomerase SurA
MTPTTNRELTVGTRSAKTARLALLACLSITAMAQSSSTGTPQTTSDPAVSVPVPVHGQLLDQVVAVVNGDLILESDIDEERRFSAFQPFRDQSKPFSRADAIGRLVDRALIQQQAKLQPGEPVTDADVQKQLASLRKDIPACKEYQCSTDAGWEKFVAAQGFTVPELTERWRQRMQVLSFIEMRFKMGQRITPAEIKSYYDKTLLPEYARQKAPAPKLEVISDRIQEILLQQQVSALLVDWLNSLKAQGTVRMAKAGEVEP